MTTDSVPAPEANGLWDEIPVGCEVRRCNRCHLVYLAGHGQAPHFPYCPEGGAKVQQFNPLRLPSEGITDDH